MDAQEIVDGWRRINWRARRPDGTVDAPARDAEIRRLIAAAEAGGWRVAATWEPGRCALRFEPADGAQRLDAHYRDRPDGRGAWEIASRDRRHAEASPVGVGRWSAPVEINVGGRPSGRPPDGWPADAD